MLSTSKKTTIARSAQPIGLTPNRMAQGDKSMTYYFVKRAENPQFVSIWIV